MTGSTEAGPMVAVRAFVAGFNDDDTDRMQAACTNETSIIDDFPPHDFQISLDQCASGARVRTTGAGGSATV